MENVFDKDFANGAFDQFYKWDSFLLQPISFIPVMSTNKH